MTTKTIAISRWKVVVAILALTFIVAVPALASETMTLTITGDSRSVSITQATLEAVSYSHEAQPSAGTISLTVDDSSATNDGWNVTITAEDFVNGDKSIPASNFSITGANGPAHVAGLDIDPTGGPKVPESGATGPLDTPRKVLQADAGFGAGSYSQVLDVELMVPGQTPAGSYVSNLTVNITAGP